jgi:hypothetical protein
MDNPIRQMQIIHLHKDKTKWIFNLNRKSPILTSSRTVLYRSFCRKTTSHLIFSYYSEKVGNVIEYIINTTPYDSV